MQVLHGPLHARLSDESCPMYEPALVPRRDGDPSSLPWGQHVAVRAPMAEREALLSRLSELGAPYEEVRGRIYTADPDGLTLEIVFDG